MKDKKPKDTAQLRIKLNINTRGLIFMIIHKMNQILMKKRSERLKHSALAVVR